ncbi:MAG TPA: endonuclease domain-containing protein [Lacipirellulaceae bacterium]|nr:endonuclease domain-containing protein [Lacipirellulaceae bacterium]
MYEDRNQRDFARALHNNMTDAGRRLWSLLRSQQLKGLKFRRQAAMGRFVVDFVCFSQKLIIELDGGQHNESSVKEYDDQRTIWLESQGFRVLRIWNHDVFENPDGVVDLIWHALSVFDQLASRTPSSTLPTEGREIS